MNTHSRSQPPTTVAASSTLAIFAEMVKRQALFLEDSEFHKLLHIFKLLSTPAKSQWPGVSSLWDWHVYPQWEPSTITDPSSLSLSLSISLCSHLPEIRQILAVDFDVFRQ
jgi:hypothetical protein